MEEKELLLMGTSLLQCSCGSSPSQLKVTSVDKHFINDNLRATEEDNKANENIFPFGICSLTQKPCEPAPLKWLNKVEWCQVNGMASITDQCKLPCSKGGMITCKDAGQYLNMITRKREEEEEEESVYYNPFDEENTGDEVKTGGINTRFYDEQGTQVYEIPQKLHKVFNEEYGIKIAYDKENEMLYHEGDCSPAYDKISQTAIEHWKRELNPETTSKGKLLFGYNFGYKIINNDETFPVFLGECPYTMEHRKHSIAFVDLGDYDDNLQPLGVTYKLEESDDAYDVYHIEKPKFTNRYMGLARGLEHEFIGHVILNYFDLPDLKRQETTEIEILLGNVIRKEIDIPERKKSQIANRYNKEKGIVEKVFETDFGFHEKNCNESDEDIYTWPNAPSPASKCPDVEGTVTINTVNALKIAKANYIITINYKHNEKVFDFI